MGLVEVKRNVYCSATTIWLRLGLVLMLGLVLRVLHFVVLNDARNNGHVIVSHIN